MLKTNRRPLRGVAGVAMGLSLVVVLAASVAFAKARSAILLIGDGMGPEQVKAASIKFHGANGKLAMQVAPAKGFATTHSADAAVTDSAAAGTALATGKKTGNGVIAISVGGTNLKTILEACRDEGKATGLVATSTITHATPASFASHVESRNMEYEIAGQLIDTKVNVLFGGGKGHFLGATSTAEAWIGINVTNAKGEKIMAITDTVNWTEYRKLGHTFLAPPGAVKAGIWLWRAGGNIGIYVDDIVLNPVDDKGKSAGDNLVVNPDFESKKLDGWDDWGGMKVVEDGGSMAAKVASSGGGEHAVAIEAGKNYGVEYRVRLDDPAASPEKLTPWESAKKNKYRRIEAKEELARARGKYVLGLFKSGALETKPDEPTLTEMTDKAIDLLSGDRQGFFLMVEGSQIDWACHGGDEKDFFRQMKSFDEAVAAAVAYAEKRGDVLVVVTADHETGDMSVTGSDAASLKVKFGSDGHTAARVPVFAFGPGSEKFSGEMDNTEIPKKIAEALEVEF
jgi:alkaline phosphatase